MHPKPLSKIRKKKRGPQIQSTHHITTKSVVALTMKIASRSNCMQLPDSYFLDNTTPKIKMAVCETAHPEIVKKPCIKHPQYLKPYYQRLQTVWRQQEHDVLTRKNASSNGGDVCEKREFWEAGLSH
jgi:hypothetical protein